MLVTLTAEDFNTLEEHGSVALITGTSVEDGTRVTFGAEPRLLEDIAQAAFYDEEEICVEIEDWQIWGAA
jgi:hypothetical protein